MNFIQYNEADDLPELRMPTFGEYSFEESSEEEPKEDDDTDVDQAIEDEVFN